MGSEPYPIIPDHPKPLTLSFVRRVTVPGRYGDGHGVYLVVKPTGAKNWMQRITVQRRRMDLGLGAADKVTPAEARRQAARNQKIARSGGNLRGQEARPQKSPRPPRSLTFARWNADLLRRSGGRETDREAYGRVRLHANPQLGRRPLEEIGTDEIVELLTGVARQSRPTARWLRTRLATIFAAAIYETLITVDPMDSDEVRQLPVLVPRQIVKEEQGRVALRKLPEFLHRIEHDGRRPATFRLIRFMLLTACHPAEARLATWDQFDMEARSWRCHVRGNPQRAEVERELTGSLIEILKAASGSSMGRGAGLHVFSSHQGANKPFDERSISMSLRRAGYERIVPLDFQRAHRVWVSEDGGNADDLAAWEKRLRQLS